MKAMMNDEVSKLLEGLIRKGRVFGIQILAASQTKASASNLSRGTTDQMALRITFRCSEIESTHILAEDNLAAARLTRKGEAIYNSANGAAEANVFSQIFTTEGKVARVDRVLHVLKLHGSINWLRVERSSGNIWGIRQGVPKNDQFGDLMIYPSPIKEGEILGYPYSEMFRHFSFSINRPQSVLFTIGYSFNDRHINHLIYQCFAIPSFTLVIISPRIPENEEHELHRLAKRVKNDRIILITGVKKKDGKYIGGAGTFQGFTLDWLPDIQELDIEKKIKIDLGKLIEENDTEVENNDESL